MHPIALLLALTGFGQDAYPLDCIYNSRAEKEIVVARNCAARTAEGGIRLDPARFRDLTFSAKTGLAEVDVRGWHYVRRDRVSAPVMAFDNMADEFHNDRARSPRNGKIGYVNRRLALAIPARFDGAFPFEKGRAVVCFGCTSESDGEHSFYAGGSWTCIDTRGREIRPRIDAAPGKVGATDCGRRAKR
jgi:hypothetical protein